MKQVLTGILLMLAIHLPLNGGNGHEFSKSACISVDRSREVAEQLPAYKQQEVDPRIFMEMRNSTLVIPVVVHIVHDGGEENIHDSLVFNQIEALNEDFGRYGLGENQHPTGGDMRIRFKLAKLDPAGNETNGINRIQSDSTNFNSRLFDEPFKRLTNWDPKRYLNIWVVKSIDGDNEDQQVLAYAYLPARHAGSNRDGIVIGYRFFGRQYDDAYVGRYNLGKILTHEAGHYLNLLHTWGDGDCNVGDGIHDTPDCDGPFESLYADGCPAPEQCGNRRMIENHMDYSDDGCSNLFTIGQRDRMRNAIFQYRSALISYENMYNTGLQDYFAEINRDYNHINQVDVFPNPLYTDIHDLNIYVLYTSSSSMEFYLYNLKGERVWEHYEDNIEYGKLSFTLHDLPSGRYFLRTKRDGDVTMHNMVIY